MRKRLSVFGHNAPPYSAAPQRTRRHRVDFAISPECGAVDIDGSVTDLLAGSLLVLARGSNKDLFRVTGVDELSRADYAVSGKVTRAWLHGDLNRYATYYQHVRDTVVYAVNERLTLAMEPDTERGRPGTRSWSRATWATCPPAAPSSSPPTAAPRRPRRSRRPPRTPPRTAR